MASFSATIVSFSHSSMSVNYNINQGVGRSPSIASLGWANSRFQPLRKTRLSITCAAKTETIEKVCDIVKKQLALSADTEVTAETTFAKLGADSLDTVEIVMALEEEFDISVEEENAQSITNIQEAAEVIEKLVEKKAA